jgi:hypothetical protein
MVRRAVLDEPRLNTAHAASVDRLVHWLGDHGFERLDGDKLPAWMAGRIARADAYGSVVVLPRGVWPVKLLEGPRDDRPLWLEYLRSGGRIVHTGDLPANYAESPVGEAVNTSTESRGASLLGLRYGWDSPYWGQGGLPVTPTRAAKDWGLETGDGPITGVRVEDVSSAFHVYTVPQTGKQGACDWFRNVRPQMPWSGLVKILQGFDGNSDAALRDVWRAAHYVGRPVAIPPLPPLSSAAAPRLRILTAAGGMEGRREFVRGEQAKVRITADDSLQATAVRLDLLQAGRTLLSQVQPAGKACFSVQTAPFRDGAYTLRAAALKDEKIVAACQEEIGIRHLPPRDFLFHVWHGIGANPWRTGMEIADIARAGLEPHFADPTATAVDAAVRNHVGFSLRAMPDLLPGKQVTFEKNPEYFRLDAQGKPVGTPYSAGRPSPGISHPKIVENAGRTIEAQVRAVAGLPSFRPYALCNDDYQIYYGWDYAPRVLAAFKAETGLEAPRKMELPPKFGAIPDGHPWVRWFEWTLVRVVGAYNRAETQGALRARPDVRIGPIPGPMQIPLVALWEASQYPPYNFGPNGFNLLASYYYNTYWQPVMTVTFWMETGRMGNRELREWNMPDAFMTAGYTRNNLFHYLAGGVGGLAYYYYAVRNDSTWPELGRLGKVVRRIGPVQARLAPAGRDIGLLNSFTTNCFDPGHTLAQVYAYHNLVQGHFSVETLGEDEILSGRAGRYQAVLLYNVKYLRRAVYDALAAHAAHGGLVILDASVPFDLPGAKRLPVDVGLGRPNDPRAAAGAAQASTPGIYDYGHADRIEAVKRALRAYVKPQFESADIRLGAWQFTAGGVPYTWFVNAHDGKEYMFCRQRMGAGHPGAGTPEKVAQLRAWETAETAKGPYLSTVEFDRLPGQPYDLVAGRKLRAVKTPSGRYRLALAMQRFGGALVAWLPAEIQRVEVSAPETACAGRAVRAAATVFGSDRPIAGLVAVEFVLREPSGSVSVASDVRATTAGRAGFDWTPAVNDTPGRWTLEATELASGKTATVGITLHD